MTVCRTIPTLLLLYCALAACSVVRHVPADQTVVSRVRINDTDGHKMNNADLRMAVAQKPYHRTFGLLPVAAWIWHNDTTTAWHRWRGRVGTEPPTLDESLTARTEQNMVRTLASQGYLAARVTHQTLSHRRKSTIVYTVDRGTPHRIASLVREVDDDSLRTLVEHEASTIAIGQRLDMTRLEAERTRLTERMRTLGYWDFNKEDVSYMADTMRGDKDVDLTMTIAGQHRKYRIASVTFATDFDLMARSDTSRADVHRRDIGDGYTLQYTGRRCYLRDRTLLENCRLRPGSAYNERDVQTTYAALSRLRILKYVNIRFTPSADDADALDCLINISPRDLNTVQFELDGTNTSGDLGFAALLTYQHRNLMRGSETYSATLKGGYESLSGNVSGLVNDNYKEYTFENTLDIPKFLFPLLTDDSRRRSRATTSVKAAFSYQDRPEYSRIIAQGAFSYRWTSTDALRRQQWNVADLVYVRLPKQSAAFMDIIRNAGPISYASYQSHFILAMSYSITIGNTSADMQSRAAKARDVWSVRINPELAGTTLRTIASATHLSQREGRYAIFNQPFEQYARLDVDWSYSKYLTDRSRLAFHAAGGVAAPFGNSDVLPFEKRYYSGGANSVRGWSVRTLGPGRYRTDGGRLDYFNQSGDVRLDASVELRSRLFWNLEFAAFVDGGNIWTIRSYDAQPGGVFTSDFYRELAAAWGIGVRLVTDFVVLRLDLGLKAYDPTVDGTEAWRIREPLRASNRTIHFAVGYPF